MAQQIQPVAAVASEVCDGIGIVGWIDYRDATVAEIGIEITRCRAPSLRIGGHASPDQQCDTDMTSSKSFGPHFSGLLCAMTTRSLFKLSHSEA